MKDVFCHCPRKRHVLTESEVDSSGSWHYRVEGEQWYWNVSLISMWNSYQHSYLFPFSSFYVLMCILRCDVPVWVFLLSGRNRGFYLCNLTYIYPIAFFSFRWGTEARLEPLPISIKTKWEMVSYCLTIKGVSTNWNSLLPPLQLRLPIAHSKQLWNTSLQ